MPLCFQPQICNEFRLEIIPLSLCGAPDDWVSLHLHWSRSTRKCFQFRQAYRKWVSVPGLPVAHLLFVIVPSDLKFLSCFFVFDLTLLECFVIKKFFALLNFKCVTSSNKRIDLKLRFSNWLNRPAFSWFYSSKHRTVSDCQRTWRLSAFSI